MVYFVAQLLDDSVWKWKKWCGGNLPFFLFTEKAFIFSRNQSLSVWGTYFWNTARYFLVTTKTYRKCVFSPPKFAQIIPCRF